jgi:hypothetical protein
MVVVQREQDETVLKRLSSQELADWLKQNPS